MRQRALSAVVIVPVVGLALATSPAGIAILGLVLAALAGREAERLLVAAGRPVIPGGVMAGAVAIVAITGAAVLLRAADQGPLAAASFWAAGPALVLVALGAAALRQRDSSRAFAAWEGTAFGALYVGLIALVVALAAGVVPALPASGSSSIGPVSFFWEGARLPAEVQTLLAGGRGWPLALIAAVWSFDTGAYLVGRAIGRRPFFAWISPSKTLEGFIGGVVVATVVTVLALGVLGRPPLDGLVLGPLLAFAAQAGDLAESTLKRAAGAKDSGTLIPGHGGVLDRIDSFLFAAPALAAYVALVSG